MVVRAKGQKRENADLANGQVFDRIFNNSLAFDSRISVNWKVYR